MLNGLSVAAINPDLTSDLPITTARRLSDNAATSFIGIQKSGPLDIPGDTARALLVQPTNVNGRPNTDVLSPWWIGIDVTRRPRDYWIINFNGFEESAAAKYEAPFELLGREITRYEAERGRKITRPDFWRLWRRRPELFAAIGGLKRFIATPEVAKHRVFVFLDTRIVPDKNLTAIARDDDTTFGILHSRFHEAWSLRLGTSLEDRPRYTPTTTFETYPFPDGLTPNLPAAAYADDPRARRIARAARVLDEARGR